MKTILKIFPLFLLLSCATPQAVCTCYDVKYFQHLENEKQELFRTETDMSNCDNWTIGDDTKTDDNGYLYNYLKVCE